jgi:hypothetical protein
LLLSHSYNMRLRHTQMSWTDLAGCNKIFVTENNRLSLARNADAYGSGFIIDGNTIKGQFASCQIKARKIEGSTYRLIAVCSTDIALSTTELNFRMDDANTLTRFFSAVPDMTMSYSRCPTK